jgi:hypothetical protein
MARANTNLFFLSRRLDREMKRGVQLQDAHYADSKDLALPSIILGGYRNGWLIEKTGSKIPVDPNLRDLPVISDRGKAIAGSIVDMEYERKDGTKGKRKTLVGPCEEDVFYLTVKTGLVGDGDGVLRDKLKLLSDLKAGGRKMVPHGSFSLDGGAVELGSGVGDGLELGTVEAELVKWGRSQSGVAPGVDRYTFRQWRMPVGSSLLVQEIDSADLLRVVATREGLQIVDANGYAAVFEHLEEKRLAALKK